jgi:triosephosphate isomerase
MAGGGIRALVVGNWKMNGTAASLVEMRSLAEMLAVARPACDVIVCPPATLAARAVAALDGDLIAIGGQDCHWNPSGAHTGDISAEMLVDCGCRAVIVGHSERRTDHGEDDRMVRRKAEAAHRAGLVSIICIGETLQQRKAGETLDIVSKQIVESVPSSSSAGNTVLAYEPVWAIGTGLTPTAAEVAEVHAHIRSELGKLLKTEGNALRILYGGSVKPANAAELMAVVNVNGALVGGASLKAQDFMGIIRAYA